MNTALAAFLESIFAQEIFSTLGPLNILVLMSKVYLLSQSIIQMFLKSSLIISFKLKTLVLLYILLIAYLTMYFLFILTFPVPSSPLTFFSIICDFLTITN